MKVLHVLDHSAPIYDGYAFRSLEILRALGRNGIQTVQVTSAKQGATASPQETHDGLLYHRTASGTGRLARLPVLDQWDVVRTLSRRLDAIVARERPDLLHAHSPSLNGIAAARTGRRHGIPVVYEIRAFWEDAAVDNGSCREGDLRYRVTRALETHVVRTVDRVVCICRGLHDDIAARGIPAERLSIVPNAVDLDRFTPGGTPDPELAARLGLTAGRTIGFIGSFFGFEGLDVLVDAARFLRDRDPACRVLLVGSGTEAERLRARVAQAGVDDVVVFTGRVPQDEVGRYYDLIDLLVYPRVSMRITELVTPLKPLEAMAMRRNVLASDVGGHRELIEDGRNGLLFRAGDAHDLADRALGLLDDPVRAAELRENAFTYVSTERGWQANVGRYLDLYADLLGPGRMPLRAPG